MQTKNPSMRTAWISWEQHFMNENERMLNWIQTLRIVGETIRRGGGRGTGINDIFGGKWEKQDFFLFIWQCLTLKTQRG